MSANSLLEEKMYSLNQMIKDTNEYKDYILNKRLLESNNKLSSLKLNLENMKHVMCNCDDEDIKEEYKKARSEFDSSPIVINYRISEVKLNELIRLLINEINNDL